MKKNIFILLVAVMGAAFTFSSCNKYEDGPKISLLTKKARLVNTWKVENVTSTSSNGNVTDLTSLYSDLVLTIKKDETYTITWGSSSDAGTWELGGDKDDIRFMSSQPNSTEMSYRILKLKSKELWWKHTEPNGTITETHYIEK